MIRASLGGMPNYSEQESQGWWALIFQLPPKTDYFRVKVWRRLQNLGAVALKNAVYLLPTKESCLEDFQWLQREIVDKRGEAAICHLRLVDGLTDSQVRALFDAARDADYEDVMQELRALFDTLSPQEKIDEIQERLARYRKRAADIAGIDFFGASGRQKLEALLTEMSNKFLPPLGAAKEKATSQIKNNLENRLWVTRSGVGIDRLASAWLIKGFIDPRARFKFVSDRDYIPLANELRFDMFAAEFTHRGDSCTFEVLLEETGLSDPALRNIGEIVHDLDLKDNKFNREEAAGIRRLMEGLCRTYDKDEDRLLNGKGLFDTLYASLRR